MGSATQDYIGGIAGLNVGSRTAGTIENCTTEKNCTVTGRNTVGGIVGVLRDWPNIEHRLSPNDLTNPDIATVAANLRTALDSSEQRRLCSPCASPQIPHVVTTARYAGTHGTCA